MDAWIRAGVTTRGTSHIKKDIVCQDAIAEYTVDSFYGIALADGAGSLKHSDIGAKLMTRLSLRYMSRHFNDIYTGVVKQETLLAKIEHVLQLKAKKLDIPYKEMGSTLLMVAVKHDMFISIHIGDGVISYIDKNNRVKVLSHPMNGEFSNMTFFTTTPLENRLRIVIGELKNAKAFMLMSDGLSDSLYSDKEKTMQQNTSLLLTGKVEELGEQKAIKWFENFIAHNIVKRTGDDISLIVMHQSDKSVDKLLESKLAHYQVYEKQQDDIAQEIRKEKRKSITSLVEIQKREMLRDMRIQEIVEEAKKKMEVEKERCEVYKQQKKTSYEKRKKIIGALTKEYLKIKYLYDNELEKEKKERLKKTKEYFFKPFKTVMRISYDKSRDFES